MNHAHERPPRGLDPFASSWGQKLTFRRDLSAQLNKSTASKRAQNCKLLLIGVREGDFACKESFHRVDQALVTLEITFQVLMVGGGGEDKVCLLEVPP